MLERRAEVVEEARQDERPEDHRTRSPSAVVPASAQWAHSDFGYIGELRRSQRLLEQGQNGYSWSKLFEPAEVLYW